MVKVLYLVMKNSPGAHETLEELSKAGFNATVINTESLHQALDYYPEEHHFFNLRQLERMELQESVLCWFLLDAERLEQAKSIIREQTEGFTHVKGFMFSQPIEDYEGSV